MPNPPQLTINAQGREQIINAEKNIKLFRTPADSAIPNPSNHTYQINVFFDGTSNNGPLPASDEVPTNVYNIYQKLNNINKTNNAETNNIYARGIGASTTKSADQVSDFELNGLQQGFVIGDDLRQLNAAYQEYLKKAKYILTKDPDAIIIVNTIAFSRGAAVGREFINMVDQFGVPKGNIVEKSCTQLDRSNPRPRYVTLYYQEAEGNEFLRKPGDVKQNALIYDTVPTGMDYTTNANVYGQKSTYPKSGKPTFRLGIPASVVSAVQFIAQDEMRDNKFAPVSIKTSPDNMNDFRLLEIALPGAHADIGGSYRTGPSSTYQYFSELYLSKLGILPQSMISPKPDMPLTINDSRWNEIIHLLKLRPDQRPPTELLIRDRPITFVTNSYPSDDQVQQIAMQHANRSLIENQPYRKGQLSVDMTYHQILGEAQGRLSVNSISEPILEPFATWATQSINKAKETLASIQTHATAPTAPLSQPKQNSAIDQNNIAPP